MSDYYTESQMQRIEQAAYDGATLEAGKEWERQRYEFDATEAKLVARIAELEAENDRLQAGWFRDETICPDGSLRPKVSDLLNRIAELEAENAVLKQLPQPIKFWSDEKKQIYKINERRSVKSGSEECGDGT